MFIVVLLTYRSFAVLLIVIWRWIFYATAVRRSIGHLDLHRENKNPDFSYIMMPSISISAALCALMTMLIWKLTSLWTLKKLHKMLLRSYAKRSLQSGKNLYVRQLLHLVFCTWSIFALNSLTGKVLIFSCSTKLLSSPYTRSHVFSSLSLIGFSRTVTIAGTVKTLMISPYMILRFRICIG